MAIAIWKSPLGSQVSPESQSSILCLAGSEAEIKPPPMETVLGTVPLDIFVKTPKKSSRSVAEYAAGENSRQARGARAPVNGGTVDGLGTPYKALTQAGVTPLLQVSEPMYDFGSVGFWPGGHEGQGVTPGEGNGCARFFRSNSDSLRFVRRFRMAVSK